jgi:hypothetical protein
VIGAPAAVLLAALPLAASTPAPGVEWSSMAATAPNGGPIKVNVLRIDRAALAGWRLTVALAHGRTLSRERTSAMARRNRALVATNGAVWGLPAPVSGDPIGVVISNGRLVSEPLEGRSGLLVPRDPTLPPRIATSASPARSRSVPAPGSSTGSTGCAGSSPPAAAAAETRRPRSPTPPSSATTRAS